MTEGSRLIKAVCEVEKLWIILELDKNGVLGINEIFDCLSMMSLPSCELSQD